jgi:murein DD-endopeptidase MepM/ murein hydrolase activator NlpD
VPTVPDTFAPSVTQGDSPMVPATGQWTSPIRNHAPSLLGQTGATLSDAGSASTHVGNEIANAVQQTVDGAQTKAAETQFIKASQDVLYNPQGGYLNTRGMDAQAQWAPATKAIVKARQDARAMLTNPNQLNMFDESSNQHILSLGRTMSDHQHGQVTQYSIQQSQDHADTMLIQARDAYLNGRQADYQKASDTALADVLKVAELQSGAPPDSDIAKAMVRVKRTDLVHGIVTGLLDNHQYNEAKQFFDHERGNIDMRTAEVLGNAVKVEYDRNLVETKGDAFLAAAQTGGTVPHTYGPLATGSTINPLRITDVPGSPRPGGRTHDGYDISMPAGTQVTAPLDGKVVKVWDDQQYGGGLSMRVQLADGNTMGVAHLSQANLKEGDSINRGQVIALSGKSGNATGPTLHVALMDRDGKYVDYFGASKPQPDPAGIADPDVLQRAIDAAKGDDSLDPHQQKLVVRYMEAEHSHQRAIEAQQYEDVKQQAVDYYFNNNQSIDGLPTAIKAKLKPQDLASFENRPDKTKNDVETEYGFVSDPASLTVPNVKAAYAQGKLSDSGLIQWTERAMKLENSDEKVRAASINQRQFTDILALNQLPHLAMPKSGDEKLQRVQLETAATDEIDVLQQKAGRALTRDEKAKVMRDLVVDKVYTPGWFTAGTPKPVALLTPDEMKRATVYVGGQTIKLAEIPAQYQQQATQDLRAVGAAPTQANIAAWWLRKGKPRQ